MGVFLALVASALEILSLVMDLYIWLLVVNAVLSWLVVFDVVNPRNRLIAVIGDFTDRVTEPLLRPIRRFVPPVGGLDLSPIILIFVVMFLQSFIRRLVFGL